MISYIKGTVLRADQEFIILETQGVGYKVYVAESVLSKLSKSGEPLELFCSLQVRETSMDLYGFPTWEALRVFEVINDIQGIGPKTALELSGFGSLEELKEAIEQKGTGVFQGMKGIGAKRQQKILLELAGVWQQESSQKVLDMEEALRALVGLGFSKRDSKEALEKISSHIADTEEQVKEALKYLGKAA